VAIVGREVPAAELAGRLADVAPWAQVIVTAHENGPYLGRRGGPSQHITPPQVEAVDTSVAATRSSGSRCLFEGEMEPATGHDLRRDGRLTLRSRGPARWKRSRAVHWSGAWLDRSVTELPEFG
jgi:hypothetical protein